MPDQLFVLESAISDVGGWSWWAAELPAVIQVEFTGVQLWRPPMTEDKPPNGQIALRFKAPSFVAFLTRGDVEQRPASTWPEMLHNDELGVTPLSTEEFTLTDSARLSKLLDEAADIDIRIGHRLLAKDIPDGSPILGLWARNIGLVVVADELQVVGHAGDGKGGVVPMDQIAALHNKWWDYWKEYWKRRDTDDPMPKDYACEVTWPVGWDQPT